MQNANVIVSETSPLASLIQPSNFVGWVYSIDYDTARIMTNDLWKANALGVPHNCFLLAASFNPEQFASVAQDDRQIILLRVIGSAKLPQDDDLIRSKIDNFKDRKQVFSPNGADDMDDITRNEIQFGGLECRVLGTFFVRDNDLWLGSDIESFESAVRLSVYRPRGNALQTIVSYIDPIRKRDAEEEAQRLGISGTLAGFPIGTVRYTSTDRLHRNNEQEQVAVSLHPFDFISRRTAVLGMTRTGKSNMIKQLVSVVKRVADDGGIKIGQLIYDINGEYAQANQQDKGSLADIYKDDSIRYRMIEKKGFEDLRNNFYEQINEGFGVIQRELDDANRVTNDYVRAFVNMSLARLSPIRRRSKASR